MHQELASHREEVERRLAESITRSEDFTFQRIEKLFSPQIAELRLRLDETFPRIQSRIEEVSEAATQDHASVVKRLDNSLDTLNVEITSIHSHLPVLRRHCEEHAKRLYDLEEMKPTLFQAMDQHRKETYDWKEHIEHELANECRRAEGAEAAFAHRTQERLDTLATITREVDERATKKTNDAMHTVGMAEKHVLARLDETRDFVLMEARRLAAEAATSLRPEIHEIVEMLQKGMDECRLCLETRSCGIEAMMRREMQDTLRNAFEDSNREMTARYTHVLQIMSEGFENARGELRDQVQSLTDTADRWREIQDRALDHTKAEADDARKIADKAKTLASTVDKWVALHGSKVDRTFAYLAVEPKPPWTPTTVGSFNGTMMSEKDNSYSGTFPWSQDASPSPNGSSKESRPITTPGRLESDTAPEVVF